jgi:hypothetical protein
MLTTAPSVVFADRTESTPKMYRHIAPVRRQARYPYRGNQSHKKESWLRWRKVCRMVMAGAQARGRWWNIEAANRYDAP